MKPRRALLATILVLAAAVPGLGWGHAERPTPSPARPGSVPDQNRVPTMVLNVCKVDEPGCDFEHIQAAVNAAPEGALIQIWPGLYLEEPSRAQPHLDPDSPDGTYSYEHHIDHPNSQNLIAIVGKKNLTLRGMGAEPRNVVIDVAFAKHVGIRGDRADGLILENFSIYHAFDHGVYVLDQDGYVIDRVVSGYSRDYAFLMFATDHGVIKNCDAFGAGDAGIYPGGAANTPGRHSNEVANCRMHHSVIGYSGTQGNYVWVHDNEFYDNAVGMTSDSETDHPNYPQRGLLVERNRYHDNNFNVYAADSDIFSVFGDGLYLPVGTGLLLQSGHDNAIRNNDFWSHDRWGVWLGMGQGLVVGPTSDPPALPYLGTGNRFVANRMYPPAGVEGRRNAVDFGWDGLGVDNCWQGNTGSADGAAVTTDAALLPPCELPVVGPLPVSAGPPNPVNSAHQAGLLFFEGEPVACVIDIGGCVWGPGPAPGAARNTPEGYQPPPAPPTTCGPSSCPTGATFRSSTFGAQGTTSFSTTAAPVALPATGVGAAPLAASVLLAGAAFGVRVLRRRR